MNSLDTMSKTEFQNLIQKELSDGCGKFRISIEAHRLTVTALDADLELTFHSERDSPEVVARETSTLVIGSRVTVTTDGTTREVEIDDEIEVEFPLEAVPDRVADE